MKLKKELSVLILSIELLANGCATMRHGTTDEVRVITKNDANETETLCDLSNEEGGWRNITPNQKARDRKSVV